MISQRQTPSRRAFTLLELTVVIIVMGILLGAFVGPSSKLIIDLRQTAAAAELEREIIAARSRAMSEGRPVGIFLTASAVDGTFAGIASVAGITAATHSIYPIELSATFPVTVQISTSVIDSLSVQGTYSIPGRFTGVQVSSITNGTAATGTSIWFATDGTPEIRTLSGTRTGAQSSDINILLSGGSRIYVRAGSGLVEVH